MSGSPVGAFLLSWLSRAWLGGGEKDISGQKGYEKADTVSVIAEEKEKTHKTWYTSLYNKLFGGKYQKQKKIEKLLYTYDIPMTIV